MIKERKPYKGTYDPSTKIVQTATLLISDLLDSLVPAVKEINQDRQTTLRYVFLLLGGLLSC